MTEAQDRRPPQERVEPNLDLVIVMGRNFLSGYDRLELGISRHTLSPESRMNVLAAIRLYKEGRAKKFLFSTGFTAGNSFPSEAQAMQDMFAQILHLSHDEVEQICLKQEKTKSTDPESIEDTKIARENGFTNVAVITAGGDRNIENPFGHMDRAIWWFNKRGIKVRGYVAEEILRDKFPRLIDKYLASDLAHNVARQERLAGKLERMPFNTGLASIGLRFIAGITRK